MVGIKDFGMPSCCMNCEMFDGEYGNCDIIGDTQDFEYQWDENRPFDCPLVEAIPKDQYEARLKADLEAMLTELKTKIEEKYNEIPIDYSHPERIRAYTDIRGLIQEKIDNLKEDQK